MDYNDPMRRKYLTTIFTLAISILVGLAVMLSAQPVKADVGTPYDLISLVNGLRTANGLPALEVDPILMGTAQYTAEIMASTGSCSHIGNVSGRAAASGYGGGATVWATENIACAYGWTAEQVVYQSWADELHMLPMTNPNYVHIGAGVTTVDGKTYYVVHAAYYTGASAYTPSAPGTNPGGNPQPVSTIAIIKPVQTSTPSGDGSIVHVVQPGQSLWNIAISYGVKIADLIKMNNLAATPIVYPDQKIVIQGSFTPTLSPTVTLTPMPPTRTPTPTATPKTPTATYTITPTPTSTPRPLLPDVELPEWLNKRALGIGFIAISGIGLLMVLIGGIRKKS